jgi:hypothetical protein
LIIGAFRHIESAGSEKNLFMLGTLLSQIGSARPAHFQELLQQLIWRRARYRITILESLLSKHGRQPEFWAKDLTDYLTELRQAVATKEYAVPSDLREVFGQDAATVLMQRLVHRLGQLLQVWPQMRQAAEELRANGSRLGTQI